MARRRTRFEKKIDEELLNENLPVDVLPYSNGEHFPDLPTEKQHRIMELMDRESERVRRMAGMDRRTFVRTAAAFSVAMWAINKVNGGKYGYLAWGNATGPEVPNDPRWQACDIDNPGVQLANPPGEFVFDVQSHHVTSAEKWRALQPVHHAFICGLFGFTSQGNKEGGFAGKTNVDPCENVGRWAYLKDIYIDSSTTAGVLSPVPSAPDEQQPLPFDEANATAEMIESLTGSMRCVTHGYVMPNRGWTRSRGPEESLVFVPDPLGGRNYADGPPTGQTIPNSGQVLGTATGSEVPPLFMQDELDWMEERAIKYRRYLRGWKVYTPYGDVPFTSGMAHNDIAGTAMNEKIMELWQNYGVPPVLASHKGVPLPTFDARRQACDDVPPAAMAFPGIRFVIYHAGGGGHNPYPTDIGQSDADIDTTNMDYGTNGLLRALKIASWDATAHIPAGLSHGQSPNVYVDLGSKIATDSPDGMAIFLGKLIKHLGSRRICYGTDSLWGGSPQALIVFLRMLQFTQEAKDMFNLPYGLDGDRFDPTRNALAGSSYMAAHPAPSLAGNWPTDGQAHPERSIRNGILGRNAADAYEHDADQAFKLLDCKDVQRLRDEYLTDTVLGKATPSRSNEIYGPRSRREVIAMLNDDWKKNGWHA